MSFKPSPVFLPCVQDDVPPSFRHIFLVVGGAPTRHCAPEAYEMCTNVEGCSISEIIVYESIPTRKSLDQPQTGLDVPVQGELVQFGNHLSQIKRRQPKLAHLPVDDEQRGLVVRPDLRVRKQDAVIVVIECLRQ